MIEILNLVWLKYISIIIVGYLLSVIIKHVLDKRITDLRIDNYILYLLLVKTPRVSTKLIFKSGKRPDIRDIKKLIEKEFNLERNENVKNNSFIFKIREHSTPIKITIMEPDENKLFTITLETFGEDRLSKILKSSFSRTIIYFEKISKKLTNLNLKIINIVIKISSYLEREDKITYNYNKSASLSSRIISCSSKDFTDIEPLVKRCIKLWRNKFL